MIKDESSLNTVRILAEQSKETVSDLIMREGKPNVNLCKVFAEMYGHVLCVWASEGMLSSAFLKDFLENRKDDVIESLLAKKVARLEGEGGETEIAVLWNPETDRLTAEYRESMEKARRGQS